LRGYAVTADETAGDDEIRHLPVVFVAPGATGESPRDFGLPDFISFEGERLPLRVDVLDDPEELQCIPGIPIQQHQRIRPIRPGTAIRGLDPTNVAPRTDGSGGAIVRRRPVQPADPLYLLSARHVLKYGADLLTMMQPWIGNPANDVIGSTIAVSALNDAGICEVQAGNPDIMCIGRPMPPIPPFTTLKVKKSGAATGYTGSHITYNKHSRPATAVLGGTNMFFIDNIATYPAGGAGVTQNFVMGGDSGSMAVAGNPDRQGDFGRLVNRLVRFISAIGSGFLPAGLYQQLLMQRLTNSAIGLITHTTVGRVTYGGTVQGVPVAVATEMQVVLDDLRVDLVLQ
jgi:hypothetical protein